MFCSKCGAEIDSSLKYCVYCGEKVNASAPTPTKGKRKRKSMLVIILAVILIPVIIFSWIQGFGIHSSPEEIAKAFAQSELNADVKGMLKCLPDVMIAELIEYYELSPSASIGKLANRLEDEIPRGDVRQVYDEYKIVSAEVTREMTWQQYFNRYDYYELVGYSKYDKDCEVAAVKVCIELGDYETEVRLFCVKSNFKWYVFAIDRYNIDIGFYFGNYRAISYY